MVTAYQGGDLSLRTPKVPGGSRELAPIPEFAIEAPEWLTRALSEAATQGPEIWVDSAVMTCCNQAFELAVAHRARDVRLEHLVHAMTLVPAAVQALQAAGISDATLRRESGVIIAHDIPSVSGANGTITPKTSQEMEDVLRYAAEAAYHHRSPVTIDDILQTLFDMKRDLPTRNLLTRHRDDWSLREPVDNGQPRYGESGRERLRTSAGPPTVTDTVQNSRIDELERRVTELLALLQRSGEPVPPEQPPQPEPAYAGASPRDAEAMVSRLTEIETSVDRKFRELARTWNVLGERLQTVEDLLMESDSGTRASGATSEEWQRLNERLEPVTAKLESLDGLRNFDQKLASLETTFARVLARLDDVERRVNGVDLAPVHTRLESIQSAVTIARDVNLAPIDAQIDTFSSQLADHNLLIQAIGDRLDTFESNVDSARAQFGDVTAQLGTEVRAVASAVGSQHMAAERMRTVVENGLRSISTGNVDTSQIVEAVRTPVTSAVGEVRVLVEKDRNEQREQFDYLVTGFDRIASEYRNDLSEVHEALLKLNSNQQTLAESMDQWRSDVSGQLGRVVSRIDSVDRRMLEPMRSLETIQQRLDTFAATTTVQHRYEEVYVEPASDSFAAWLFGTETWWSDGWRTAEERAEVKRNSDLERADAGHVTGGYAHFQQAPSDPRIRN
ncbi:MAG: hypothetical protein AAF732_09335 [Pseudomonadota bacterium]